MTTRSKNRSPVEAEWLIATRDGAPSHDGGSMWFMLAIGQWFYLDRVGQLGESGEYWMGRLRVVWCQIRSSKVVAAARVD
jgi:hypothetical protein